jgi:DNA invertase Pin-like site-specific DNA recombinase
MKKVIELIRVSTESQAGDDRASIPAQRVINKRTALAHGLEIAVTIEMTDVSGASVMHAPEMHRLIELLRSRQYSGVVAREFSRLMRPENFSDMGLLQEFVDAKAVLFLPDGPIDFASKAGRFMGSIRAAMAGMERTELLERSWSAKEEMRKSGKCPSSSVTWPHGVAYTEDRGWHYTADAEKIRKAFTLFVNGEASFTAVAEHTGLARTALPTILTNPIYVGWRVYDQRRDQAADAKRLSAHGRQGDRRKMRRPESEVIRVRVIESQLISDEVFQTAQRIIEAKKNRHWKCRHEAEPRFTYSGFLVCGECQSTIYTQSGRSIKNRTSQEYANYDYYVCSERKSRARTCRTNYMDRTRLEEKLDGLFSERLTDRGYLSELTQEFTRRAKTHDSRATVERLQGTIASLHDKRERVIEAVIDGLIDREQAKMRTAAMDRDLAAANDALQREQPDSNVITLEQLNAVLEPLLEWDFLERDHKRRYLATSVPEIHVADYKIHGIGVLPSNLIDLSGLVRPAGHLGVYASHRKTACSLMRHTGTEPQPAFQWYRICFRLRL